MSIRSLESASNHSSWLRSTRQPHASCCSLVCHDTVQLFNGPPRAARADAVVDDGQVKFLSQADTIWLDAQRQFRVSMAAVMCITSPVESVSGLLCIR